jgi:hypothetical protein
MDPASPGSGSTSPMPALRRRWFLGSCTCAARTGSAVGQGWDTGLAGLAGLATDYGITVADPAEDRQADAEGQSSTDGAVETVEEAASGAQVDERCCVSADGDAAVDIVAAIAGCDEVVGLSPSVDADEITAAAVADQAVAEGRASVPPTVQRSRSGTRTRKKRATAPTLAPLTLAVDPSWQPARVFSVTGVGNAEEQERRATSTLLSTMTARRDFGRALVARFGGPATL